MPAASPSSLQPGGWLGPVWLGLGFSGAWPRSVLPLLVGTLGPAVPHLQRCDGGRRRYLSVHPDRKGTAKGKDRGKGKSKAT